MNANHSLNGNIGKRIAMVFPASMLLALILLLSACGSSDDSPEPMDDDPLQSLINRDSYTELLAHVFAIYVGDFYNAPLLAMSKFGIEGRNPDGTFINVHKCESGSVDQILDPSSTLSGVFFSFDFDTCLENGVVYNGILTGRDSAYAEFIESTNGFSLQVHPELFTTFTGSGSFNTTMSRSDELHQWETTGVTLESRTIDGNLVLDMMNTTFGYGYSGSGAYKAWLNGGFTLRSDGTEGKLLTVTNPVPLSFECDPRADLPCNYKKSEPWSFTSGQLELVAEDGSSLLLDADTSTLESLNIIITNDEGVETFEAQWSDWYAILSFKRYPDESPALTSPLSLATAELDSTPAIRQDNYVALLDYAFSVLTGDNALEPLDYIQGFITDHEPAMTSRDQGIQSDSYNCDANGTATSKRVDNEGSSSPLDYAVEFDECDVNQYQIEGNTQGQEIRTGTGALGLETTDLHWVDGNGVEWDFSGESGITRSLVDGNTVCKWQTDLMNLHSSMENADESVVTGGLQFETHEMDLTGIALTLAGRFRVTSEFTGGFEFYVSATGLKTPGRTEVANGDWNFTEGSLILQAYDKSSRFSGNNSKLEFNAADSTITLTSTDGTFLIDTPWTSWQSLFAKAHVQLCGPTSVEGS